MTRLTGTLEPDVVCILGMHRSGTSLLARILNLIGLYLGPDHVLAKGGAFQPTGLWEHEQMMHLNLEILARHGGNWEEPPIFTQGWETSPMLDDLKQRGRILIQDTFANARTWGWKDPRNCLTLPFWQQLRPQMRYVVCLRNPVDVAHSLAHRNSFSAQKSSSLWLTYVTSALQHSDGRSRLIVFYEDLMDDWQRELRRLAAFLGMPERAEQEEVRGRVREFTKKGLQHYRTSIVDTATNHPDVVRRAKELFIAQKIAGNLGRIDAGNQDVTDEQIENALELLVDKETETQKSR